MEKHVVKCQMLGQLKNSLNFLQKCCSSSFQVVLRSLIQTGLLVGRLKKAKWTEPEEDIESLHYPRRSSCFWSFTSLWGYILTQKSFFNQVFTHLSLSVQHPLRLVHSEGCPTHLMSEGYDCFKKIISPVKLIYSKEVMAPGEKQSCLKKIPKNIILNYWEIPLDLPSSCHFFPSELSLKSVWSFAQINASVQFSHQGCE